jgi:hypothetical protein
MSNPIGQLAMADQQRDVLKRSIQSELESTIEARIDRYLSVNHQWFIANHHFAHASRECLLLFRDGYFTSCIMVAQALSDGILKFVAERNNLQQAEKERKQAFAKRMQESGIVSEAFTKALDQIQGSYRNDFHHMNPPVATVNLEELARRNIMDLAVIEREIFECSVGPDGKFVLKNPQYWDLQPDGSVPAYVRGH